MPDIRLELCIRNQPTALTANVNSCGAESVSAYGGKPAEHRYPPACPRHFPFSLFPFSPCNYRAHPSFLLFIIIRQSPNITARACLILSGHLGIRISSLTREADWSIPQLFFFCFFFLTPEYRWLDYVI